MKAIFKPFERPGAQAKQTPAADRPSRWSRKRCMKALLPMLPILISAALQAQGTEDYFKTYTLQGRSDYKIEQAIIKKEKTNRLIDDLAPFLRDTLPNTRQKAYYFVYKKGMDAHISVREQQKLAHILLEGCKDFSSGVVGQNISYLQNFPLPAFNKANRQTIEALLMEQRQPHRDKAILLAGFAGAGKEWMSRAFLRPGTDEKTKRTLALALARQGSEEHIHYYMENIKALPVDNNFVSYIVPELIYTRQKEPLDYCIGILNNKEELCLSPNPEKSQEICCGYLVMNMVAPAIKGFPFETDATGTIVSDDYAQALITIREWFSSHPDYETITERY